MLKKEVLIEAQPQLNASIGEDIGYELGAKMIKDYYDKYEEAGSHFMGKTILEQILNQPNCIGIKIFKALNENGVNTYVVVGVNKIGETMIESAVVNPQGQIEIAQGIVADRFKIDGWFDSSTKR